MILFYIFIVPHVMLKKKYGDIENEGLEDILL